MGEQRARGVPLAAALPGVAPAEVQSRLDTERRASQATEIALFGPHEQILAASLDSPLEGLPSQPPADLVRQVQQRRPDVTLQPPPGGRYPIRTPAALGDAGAGPDARFVVGG